MKSRGGRKEWCHWWPRRRSEACHTATAWHVPRAPGSVCSLLYITPLLIRGIHPLCLSLLSVRPSSAWHAECSSVSIPCWCAALVACSQFFHFPMSTWRKNGHSKHGLIVTSKHCYRFSFSSRDWGARGERWDGRLWRRFLNNACTAEYKDILSSQGKIFTCLSFLHIERNFPSINFISGPIYTSTEGLH